jgi:hypothetical protein
VAPVQETRDPDPLCLSQRRRAGNDPLYVLFQHGRREFAFSVDPFRIVRRPATESGDAPLQMGDLHRSGGIGARGLIGHKSMFARHGAIGEQAGMTRYG